METLLRRFGDASGDASGDTLGVHREHIGDELMVHWGRVLEIQLRNLCRQEYFSVLFFSLTTNLLLEIFGDLSSNDVEELQIQDRRILDGYLNFRL